jgi:hypothetical protein
MHWMQCIEYNPQNTMHRIQCQTASHCLVQAQCCSHSSDCPYYTDSASLFAKILRSSSICKSIEVVFHLKTSEVIEVLFYLPKFHLKHIWGRLPFTKIFEVVFRLPKYLRSSSFYKGIWGRLPFTEIFEVVLHLWVKPPCKVSEL